jgi:glutamate dehydrogenase (NAD(P)+)
MGLRISYLLKLDQAIPIPLKALKLLERSEKETTIFLNVRVDDRTTITADAFVVYHNTARGPAKGGIRFAPDLTLPEVRDLAERMTWKTALTGIPFGGGKSGVALDPKTLSPYAKREIIREFVHLIRNELTTGSYIPAPDLGTGPREMAVIYGELHIPECVTGKPVAVGGIPGRREATGRGVATAARLAAQRILRKEISECTVAVQGFGNVGRWTARFLSSLGAKVVAISDSKGGAFNGDGLDIEEL